MQQKKAPHHALHIFQPDNNQLQELTAEAPSCGINDEICVLTP